jgi:intracellular sulfur oxidation DsrE/DsrF family protein
MHNVYTRLKQLLVPLAAAAVLMQVPAARAADDHLALAGLSEGKIAFDIKEGDGKALLARLDSIDETRQSLIQQGVTPHFILAFRGPATRLVQTDQDKIKPEDRALAEKVAAKIKDLSGARGVDGFEQCSLAARQQGINTEKVLPQIRVVGNGFISLMAYQAKGYAYISP